ncbi:hypothetical protein QJS04_geneDACA016381 [Acorus gramineus]|uniref:Uncharacterized protein n=1 Tax=Acorus gramineus TaxID=55184 RepID=A0AAV9ASW5_ACOGR|nr:hypothetical protein QJS04_geneDACA016381 [Acorus gramineus]
MEEEELIRRADDDPSSSPSPSSPLGRVLSTLFASSPRHLSASFSRVDSSRQKTSRVLLDDSLYYLRRYARDLAEKGEPFDHVLVPMVEHSLKFRGSKHLRQVLMILDWLFQDEFLFQALLNDLVDIILRKEDHYFALGWCSLTSALVEMAKNDTENSIGKSSQGMENMELERVLWEHLDDLIILVEKLQSPS